MATEGFALRPRGAHVPDQIRRLELISPRATRSSPITSTTSDEPCPTTGGGSSFRPIVPPRFATDFMARAERHPSSLWFSDVSPRGGDGMLASDFANVFGNLTVWIDASVNQCVYYAGYEKIHLYAAFLRCFLNEIFPNEHVQRGVQQLEAYVQYLSSEISSAAITTTAGQNGCDQQPHVHNDKHYNASSTHRIPRLRMDRLSPKVDFRSAALIPHMLSPPRAQSPRAARISAQNVHEQPPASCKMTAETHQASDQNNKKSMRLTYPKRKRIVEMDDHEEAILELVVYFDEIVRKVAGQGRSCDGKGGDKQSTSKPHHGDAKAYVTERWLLLTSDEKARILRRSKKQLARHEFFPCSWLYNSVASSLLNTKSAPGQSELALISALITARSGYTSNGSKADEKQHQHKMELTKYFSLVVLCLHESIRRVSVFSLELAEFAWKVLCEDTITLCEEMFSTIMKSQRHAQRQLHTLKQSKMALQQSIQEIEDEIQRLQTQNMRSLSMFNLEKKEFLYLEREEQWHGHCKSLIVNCIAHLQDSVNIPAWLQNPRDLQDNSDDECADAITLDSHDVESSKSEFPSQMSDYQRLAPGFAAFHFRLRFQVLYVAHLVLLCRSYLHLHERRGVCDVMNSTAISHSSDQVDAQNVGGDHQGSHFSQETGLSSSIFSPNAITNPMEKISLSELHTLREINDALRAIEVLYAETGATSTPNPTRESATSSSKSISLARQRKLRWPRPQRRSLGTQYPAVEAGNEQSFLRSLSYCTIAASTFSSSSSFLPIGSTTKLRVDIEAHHENVIVPLGSGRRRGSATFRDKEALEGVSNQVQIRLNKAVMKLPRHIRGLLLLPVLEGGEAFPAHLPRSIATSLSMDEIVEKIHWVYRKGLDNAYAVGSSSSMTTSLASEMLPVSLNSALDALSSSRMPSVWTCEEFVEFVYASIFDAERGDVHECEREFVRFFASIQLLLSNPSSVASGSAPSIPSGPIFSAQSSSIATETMHLFALLTKLFSLQNQEGGKRKVLPSRVFPVLFYCQRVLLHVSVSKKLIQNTGFSLDVWTLASDEIAGWGLPNQQSPQSTAGAAASTRRGVSSTSSTSSYNFVPFVLLESVKALMLHVVSFPFAADIVAPMLEERYQFLLEKSTLATVSLLTPLTPGPYNLSATVGGAALNVPNGQLVEALVLPMDIAVTTIVRSWIEVHGVMEQRLGITLQGALTDASGRISFEEFVHVMTAQGSQVQSNSSGNGGHSSSGSNSSITRTRLAQIYASSMAKTGTNHQDPGRGTHWRHLLQAVVDNIDFMGMHERFLCVDFRSIQHSLLVANASNTPLGQLASWLMGANRQGTTLTLRKSWGLHQKTMKDHIELAFQADNALEGVRCWQSGRLRFDKLQQLLGVSSSTQNAKKKKNSLLATCTVPSSTAEKDRKNEEARTSPMDEELEKNELDIAWKTYCLLQWDHTRAHHFADQVRLKQLRLHKNVQSPTSSNATAIISSTASPALLPQQQQSISSSAKDEEVRPQRPVPSRNTHQRPHRA